MSYPLTHYIDETFSRKWGKYFFTVSIRLDWPPHFNFLTFSLSDAFTYSQGPDDRRHVSPFYHYGFRLKPLMSSLSLE